MNLKVSLTAFRRRSLLLVMVVALSAALLPTAAFASGYGHQGRAWDPGPRQQRGYHRPAKDDHHDRNKHNNEWNNQHNNKHDNKQWKKQHDNHRPSQCDVTYRVKRGDSLSKIASHYGVTVHQLMKANGIHNANRIIAGQVLCIPC